MTRRLCTTLLAAAALLVPAAAVHASPQQISIMQDDDLMVYRDASTRDAALSRMAALGVDEVRVTLLWSVAAQNATSTPARRARFDGADPATYPHGNWDKYDDLVRAAQRFGIGAYFSVTGPGPDFSHGVPPKGKEKDKTTWMPKAGEFKKFVSAVGERYSGTYRDENEGRTVLPRVSFWGLWNEPNQGGWLTPQFAGSAVGVIPMSPVIYRKLFLYGLQGLKSTGHAKDLILLGETAPVGNGARTDRSPMPPKQFLRELLCVNAHLQPYTGRAAKARGCSILKRFGGFKGATGYGHHPYTKAVGPTVRDKTPDSITMANINDLPTLLDRLAAKTKEIPAGLPVLITEFGYETNPPDKYSGQPLDKQAEFLNEGDKLAYDNPRVFSNTQFILRDVAPLKGHTPGSKASLFTYQSGLFFLDDTPKPSAAAYFLPFVASAAGANVNIWGQLRFRPNGVVGDQVQIEYRAPGATDWTPTGQPIAVTNGLNFFQAQIPSAGPGDYRAHWSNPLVPPGDAASRVVSLPGAAPGAPQPPVVAAPAPISG